MIKRIFAAVMSVVLVVGLCPTVALADIGDDSGDNANYGSEDIVESDANATDSLEDYDVETFDATEPIDNEASTDTDEISADEELNIIENEASYDDELVVTNESVETQEPTSLSITPLATYSGTLGTCIWEIDDNGCLTIAPADGVAGEFELTDPKYNSWPWYGYRSSVITVKVEVGVSASGSLDFMFYNCSSLTSLDLSGLDTSNVTDMREMFYSCSSLTSLDLSSPDTSNVTDMSYMFYNCSSLTSLDVSGFDTSNVTDMSYMFYNCSSLTSLDLSGFDTSNVTAMGDMFYNCSSLTSLDLSGFDTSNVRDMSNMFDRCSSLTSLDLSNFDTSNVTNMSYMFYYCELLYTLDISSFDTTKVTSPNWFLWNTYSLIYIVIGDNFNIFINASWTTTYPSEATDVQTWYDAEGNVVSNNYLRDVSSAGTYYTTQQKPFALYKTSDNSLTFYYNWAPGSSTTQKVYTGFESRDYTSSSSVPWYSYRSSIKTVSVDSSFANVQPISCAFWFNEFSNCENIDLTYLDMSNVTNMTYMFSSCSSLVSLPNNFEIPAGVTDLSYACSGCSSLASLPDGFTIPNSVTNLSYAFRNCSSLESLPASFFNSNASYDLIDLRYTFQNCTSLTTIENGFTIPAGVTDLDYTFSGCASLLTLPESFEIPWGVTDLRYAFEGCTSLSTLPDGFTIPNSVTNLSYAFRNCSSLESLPASFFNSNASYDLIDLRYTFQNCTSLTTIENGFTIPAGVTDLDYTFNGCASLESLPASFFNSNASYDSIDYLESTFQNCTSLTTIENGFTIPAGVIHILYTFSGCASLLTLPESFEIPWGVTDLRYAFEGCSSLDTLPDIPSSITIMNYAFKDCSSLVVLPDSFTIPYGVANLQGSFYGCSSLRFFPDDFTIPTSVTSLSNTFYGCTSLTKAPDIPTNATNISYAFYGCSSLISLPDIPSSVTDMSYAFYGCSSLLRLPDIPSSVTNMSYAFYDCTSLTYLPSDFKIPSRATTTNAFYVSEPYSRSNPLDTWCIESNYEYLVDAYNWVNSNRRLQIKEVADDKSELESSIETADELRQSDYTAESWIDIQAALSYANDVLDDDFATQDEVNLACETLNTAISSLVKVLRNMTIYAGADRYATANAIAAAVAEQGTYSGVIVCSGVNGKYADALSASGLSGVLGYPIVLTNGAADTLDAGTAAAVSALLGGSKGDIVVLGGTSTVSAGIEGGLGAYGTVTRVAGDDRYETSQKVYDYGCANGGWSNDYAVVAIGNNFPDALGAASFCTTNAAPMLLTNRDSATLESYVQSAVSGVDEIVIAGGATSIPDNKISNLKNTVRLAGDDRYATNLKFADWALENGMALDAAGIATGTSFPDSLGSGYLLSLTNSVLLLSSPTDNSALYDLLSQNADDINAVSVFGGENSVPTEVRVAIQTAIGGEWQTINK